MKFFIKSIEILMWSMKIFCCDQTGWLLVLTTSPQHVKRWEEKRKELRLSRGTKTRVGREKNAKNPELKILEIPARWCRPLAGFRGRRGPPRPFSAPQGKIFLRNGNFPYFSFAHFAQRSSLRSRATKLASLANRCSSYQLLKPPTFVSRCTNFNDNMWMVFNKCLRIQKNFL